MAELLPPVSPSRIVVAGDVMVDRYWFGEAARISQEAPVPVVDVVAAEDRPGGAANVALNVVAMGAGCTLVGAVGSDAAARNMRATLEAAGVVCDLVEVPDWETTRKLRVVSQRQQLLRADFEEPLPEGVGAEVAVRVEACLGAADVLVIEDYDKGAVDRPEALVAAARRAGAVVVVDPKHKDFARYAGTQVLKPNRAEFERAAGAWSNEADFAERGLAELRRADVETLVVTRGGEGSTVIDRGGRVRHLPASDVEVYDRTGAGDTVAAALAVGLGLGWDAVSSARVANLAAGLVCARMGTSAVTAPEINQAIAAAERPDEGVLTREQLLAAVRLARGRGEKIVFTNGCFDVLHAGHVGYLEEARELGDRLVVAVNDDASAGRLKGPGRPVNALERRMRVLEGLSSVDWVTPFSEDTPEALLDAVRPDVLVKGGDYAESAVVGAELVRGWGGEVRVLGLLPDCSTTSIVERIKSA
ncbi:MAG: bifunctional D-glycero-beta-D-manno-heptose-7-phosphate kinase/D-glycero-beta-D-manno-heptose 1-phosphate adenylyltransferase HldE [Gammaproteobacteria bacterium]|nr:bifunctional D-glycero-beta-D-manno-heptose-7-phosphate kinase/D-glycero-beta-D-manno-heptose 1-phosphate adenylyltransferase HldE [Gammaproteobacteria bacterium]